MRIARVLTRLNLGGPARQALASDPRLVAEGHQVRLFTGRPEAGEGDLFDAFVARGLDVVRVPGLARGLSPVGDGRALLALRRAFRAFEPDVVHTHASKAGALGRRAAKAVPRAAVVHTFHGHVLEGYFPEPVSKGLVALERRLARRTDRVIAVSHATAEDLVRLRVVEDETKLVVVPPGVELDPLLALRGRSGVLRSLLGVGEDAVLVGVLGRLAEVKRPEWALDVFQMLAERYPKLHLVFVGDGELFGMLERRITALPPALRARAHLVGARDDIAAVLADLDVVLLTSRSEGLPVALIEAGAAGKPVVATPVGGVPEVVAHERTGYLGASVDELAFGLAQLCDAPAARPAFGQRARLRVAARHSADELAKRLAAVYRAAVEVHACAS
ncbi:MAG: glycosyltransferase [Planctomycetes bacterium]|nr:glycosyltransferase [Planctomycetota bacterium]